MNKRMDGVHAPQIFLPSSLLHCSFLKRLNRYLARLLRRLERGERLLQVVGVRLHAPVENTILNLMRTT